MISVTSRTLHQMKRVHALSYFFVASAPFIYWCFSLHSLSLFFGFIDENGLVMMPILLVIAVLLTTMLLAFIVGNFLAHTFLFFIFKFSFSKDHLLQFYLKMTEEQKKDAANHSGSKKNILITFVNFNNRYIDFLIKRFA